ncbi:receptor-type tyrosine- kinase FLT3 isoform X1 [Paramuricea clavata]|uniref:Receptor-type tyrosine- kinase FLT3 isoform X1 n=1 Tax=Paramuricea clavata TaxID=317549 RepID=A0A6S7J3A7_PARCT|nr:receptor-type tyrosine- kinase FLT3 isoform X1 [Paramuricea clavata]
MPAGSIRFSGIVGRGEFGKVYVGEAQGVNRNPEWTTVAIKTLTESASEEELSGILHEIELMKDLGKHENVIQMFVIRLPDHTRDVCKDIASARTNEVTKSVKVGYQKLIGAGEMPKDSTSSTLVNASEQYKLEETGIKQAEGEMPKDSTSSTLVNASEQHKLEETGIKQAEDLNFEIASRINEEIRVALNPKELESFARQIATGMKHVSGLGIVHRDLAARNILLGEDKVLKISDFGLSREGTYIKKSNGKIPFRWLSIEAIQERTYSTACDV